MRESPEHAALVELFRHHPDLAATLVARVGHLELPPAYRVRVGDSTLRAVQIAPDLIVEVLDAAGKVVRVLAVEVQRDIDLDKLFSWPSYQWLERYRRRCDCTVVVIATRRDVAAWAARPIHCGLSVTRVIVLGPDDVPWITDTDEARENPGLAVLSAAIHGGDDAGGPVLIAASAALESLPLHESLQYNHLVFRALPDEAVRRILGGIMQDTKRDEEVIYDRTPEETWERIQRIKDELARGWVEAELRMPILRRLLAARGFTVTPECERKMRRCINPTLVETWIDRVIPAKTIEDVFAGDDDGI